jgi:flagellar basal body-associated protein FliL
MKKNLKEKKKRRSLKFQFTIFFVLFIVAIYSIVIITSFQQLVGITETIGIQLGFPVIEEVTQIIDGDAFEALSKSLNKNDPYYEKTRLELLAIKEETECVYLYTMVPVTEDVFRYIIDGSTNPDDSENFSPLGTDENIASYKKALWETINTKSFTVSALDFNTQWGWLVSSYAPILNSGGEVVGVIGCDFKAENIYSNLWSRIIRQLVVAAIFAAAGFAAYLYMVNNVNKQNERLRELKEAAEAASLALKEERDTIAAMKDGIKIGLFFMDSNFIIQKEYSLALETILSAKNLAGKKFTDVLSGSIKQKEKANLIEYFVLLFKGSRSLDKKMMEDLNPLRELDYINPETKEKKSPLFLYPRGQGRRQALHPGNHSGSHRGKTDGEGNCRRRTEPSGRTSLPL